MKQRLTALQKMSAEQALVLTEAQAQALEGKKQEGDSQTLYHQDTHDRG